MAGEALRDPWVKDWADRIDQLGLSALAVPLLELARAYGAAGFHVLLAVQPLIRGLINDVAVGRVASLLDHPELLDELEFCLLGDEG